MDSERPRAEHDLTPVRANAKTQAVEPDKTNADCVKRAQLSRDKNGLTRSPFLWRSQGLTQLIDGSADAPQRRHQRRATSKLDLILGAIAFALNEHGLRVMRDPVQQS